MALAPSTTDLIALFPPSTDSHQSYEDFLRGDREEARDDDEDEGFYPPPELDDYYVPEDVVLGNGIVDPALDHNVPRIEEDMALGSPPAGGVKKEKKKRVKRIFEIRKPIYS